MSRWYWLFNLCWNKKTASDVIIIERTKI